MLTTGIWHLSTREAAYIVDFTVGTVTRLPQALTLGVPDSPTGTVDCTFNTQPVTGPLDITRGVPLPSGLGYTDHTPVTRIEPVTL